MLQFLKDKFAENYDNRDLFRWQSYRIFDPTISSLQREWFRRQGCRCTTRLEMLAKSIKTYLGAEIDDPIFYRDELMRRVRKILKK